MIPGLGNMNPQQMKAMLKQFGIKSEDITAKMVVIECEDKKIIIENPQVTAMVIQGKKTYTIMGDEKEETKTAEEDLKLVMEQANVSKEKALKALEESSGDIAEAIMKLKKE